MHIFAYFLYNTKPQHSRKQREKQKPEEIIEERKTSIK